MLSRNSGSSCVVWVSECSSPASGRDVTVGKVRHPHELTSLLFPSGLGGKSIIDREQGRGVVWHLGMQDVDSSCPLVAAGSCNPSLRL